MNNNAAGRLSDAELDIMRALWKSGRPLKAGEIVELLSGSRSWKTPTAHVLLGRLCEKGYVCADKSGYSHKFSPLVTEEEHLASQSAKVAKRAGRSVCEMVASLIDADGIDDEEIIALSAMLEKKRAEIEKKKRGDEK